MSTQIDSEGIAEEIFQKSYTRGKLCQRVKLLGTDMLVIEKKEHGQAMKTDYALHKKTIITSHDLYWIYKCLIIFYHLIQELKK